MSWATPPKLPSASRISQVRPSCARPWNGIKAPTASIEIRLNQSTVVCVPSVRPIWRMVMVVTPTPKAASTASISPAGGRSLPSGRTTTSIPTKPKSTALHRCGPTFSPSISADSITANRGAAKLIVVDSASGKYPSALNARTIVASPAAARHRWAKGRCVRQTP
jgi:hypothetical protein